MSQRAFCKRPIFTTVSELGRVLGGQGAFLQGTELVFRDFLLRSQQSGLDPIEFANDAKARVGGIASSNIDVALAHRSALRWYIVMVVTVADQFFDDLRRELLALSRNPHESPTKTVSSFEQLLRFLDSAEAKRVASSLEAEVIDYYRRVRNSFLHPVAEKGLVEGARAISHRHTDALARDFVGRQAPNPPSQLTYDDYVLATRCVNRLAGLLNDALQLTPEDVATRLLHDETFVDKLRRTSEVPPRLSRFVLRSCEIRFGMNPGDAKEVCKIVSAQALAAGHIRESFDGYDHQ